MLPCSETASAWASTFHGPGARSGAHILPTEGTGFSIMARWARAFTAFPEDWKRLRLSLQLNMRESARWSIRSVTYKYLLSFHPAYRRNLIRLASIVNEELRAIGEELNRELADTENIQVRYSDALATADLSRAELLHPIDGWHASVEGHNVLAEAAFSDLGPSLELLGINRPSH